MTEELLALAIITLSACAAYARSARGRAARAGGRADNTDGAAAKAGATVKTAGTVEAVELPAEAAQDLTITSPAQGRAMALSEVDNPVFSSGMLGPGMAVMPSGGPVVSPVDGEVLVAFPTGHAYGLRSASGVELLIHVGMDTVELDGEHFSPRVTAGDRVRRGTPLVEVDWAAVEAAGYQSVTPIVVSNAAAYEGIVERASGPIRRGEELYAVVPSAHRVGWGGRPPAGPPDGAV